MISLSIKENNIKIQNFLLNEIKKSSIPEIYFSNKKFKIYNNLIIHYKGENLSSFYDFIAFILAKAIIKFYEPEILKRLFNYNYFYFDKPDEKIIMDEYKLIIKKNSKNNFNLKQRLIKKELINYIKNNKSIVLSGFVYFRLARYISYITKLLEESVNQFVVDKEFFEFVDLLKSYVDSKIPNNIIINLVYVNSKAFLLDENGNSINLDKFNSVYLSDISFSNNDYVLNTLVSLLPSKIFLHLTTKEDSFIKTIKMIFSDRISICTGCELCNAYQMLNLK